jgi:hypothetical protein
MIAHHVLSQNTSAFGMRGAQFGKAITTQCMFHWLLWRMANKAARTQQRSELGQAKG